MAVVICFERPLYRDRWVCRRVVLVWSSLQSDVIIAVKILPCRFLQRIGGLFDHLAVVICFEGPLKRD